MKKLSIAIVLLIIFAVYSFHEQNEAHVAIINSANPTAKTSSGSSTSSSTVNQQQASSIYKDGTYQGNVTDAYYGNVQVQTTISNGKITDVKFLQFPNDRGESIDINNQAMPQLKQEAIQVQNAQVDIVSGATQTSQAFQQSLQSSLDKAKA